MIREAKYPHQRKSAFRRNLFPIVAVVVVLLVVAVGLCRFYASEILHRGIAGGNPAAVLLALALKPEAAKESRRGTSMLQFAVLEKNEAAVEWLLRRGADPNVDNSSLLTWEITSAKPSRSILASLARHGADLTGDLSFWVETGIDEGNEEAVKWVVEEVAEMEGKETVLKTIRANLARTQRMEHTAQPDIEALQRVIDFIDGRPPKPPAAP